MGIEIRAKQLPTSIGLGDRRETQELPGKTAIAGSPCHTLVKNASDLERLADAWDTLPEEVRAKIREMVEGK